MRLRFTMQTLRFPTSSYTGGPARNSRLPSQDYERRPMKQALFSRTMLVLVLFAGCKKEADDFFFPAPSGPQWIQTSLPNNPPVQALAVCPNGTGDTNLFAGTWGYGVFRSSNNGTSWTAVNSGLPANAYVLALAAPPKLTGGTNLFASIWPNSPGAVGGAFLSTNNGASWTAVNAGLPSLITVSAFASGANGTNLFAGTDRGVFLSTNNGTSWTAANTGLDTTVASLAVLPNGIGVTNLFAGTQNGVFLSTNNGANWQAVSSGLPAYTVVLALGASTSGSGATALFVGTYGDLNSTRIYRSTNRGASWTLANSGLPTTYTVVHAFASTPAVTGGTNVVAGTTLGVFLSTDNGASWQAMNSGLTSSSVSSVSVGAFVLVPNGSGGTNLFAGTNVGVWKYPL